jgi:hypothetical protein
LQPLARVGASWRELQPLARPHNLRAGNSDFCMGVN